MSATNSEMLEAARRYTAAGLIVHPLRKPVQGDKKTGKAPIEKEWSSRKEPRSEADLMRFWGGKTDTPYNVGVLCGESSGITVLDVDDYNPAIINELFAGINRETLTISCRTEDRRHFYFKYSKELNSVKKHFIGFETLNNGSNAVLAPSNHYSGTVYKMNREINSINDFPEIPDKLLKRINELFRASDRLEASLNKCRKCLKNAFFENVLEKNKAFWHGSTGRDITLALMIELYANGAGKEELHLANKMMFRDDYNYERTEKELNHIIDYAENKEGKPWTCETLKTKCNIITLDPLGAGGSLCSSCNKWEGKTAKDDTEEALSNKKTGVRKAAKRLLSGLSVIEVVDGLQEEVPIYFDNGKNFWMWNNDLHVFERTDETEIMVQITEHLDLTIYSKDFKNQILEGIRQTGRARRVKPTKREWIQFQNCVIDVETGKTFEATPDYFFVSQIPHKLGKSEETPILDKLFSDWQGDKADLLREICAYCLLDDYPIQRIFAFVGPGGNGKGQCMKFIKSLLGSENTVGTDLDRLADSRFEAAKLFKKKAAFVGETNYTLSKTSLLKSLAGGDTISGEFKNKDPFDFVNTAKIFIATNGLPVTTDRSEGFYRRWCVLEFKKKFPDGKDIITTVPEVEYQNFCKKAMRLLKEILENGKLNEPEIADRKEQYEKLSNPIQAFIDDECKVSDSEFVPVWYLYEQYNAYREAKGHRYILQNEFAKIVEGMGYNRRQKWFNGKEIATFKKTSDIYEGKNWMAFEGLSLDSRGNHGDSRGASRIENESEDNEKNEILDDSRGSMSKTRLPLYIEPNPILLLEPLESIKNRSKKAELDGGFDNSLNTSRITSRIEFTSRISDQENSACSQEFIQSDNKESVNTDNFKSSVVSVEEALKILEEEGI